MTRSETTAETDDGVAADGVATLVVATYNVRYAGLDEGSLSWERRRDGVAATVREATPDVLAVQECWLDQLADLAARLPTYEWIGYSDGVGEHTPIGYDPHRVSVESSGAFGLAPGRERGDHGWDAALPGTVTHATLRDTAADTRLRVFSVYLDHRGPGPRWRDSSYCRTPTESVGSAPRRVTPASTRHRQRERGER